MKVVFTTKYYTITFFFLMLPGELLKIFIIHAKLINNQCRTID